MTSYPQSMVSALDTYSNVYPNGRSWYPYRPPMGAEPPSLPYAGEGQTIGGPTGVSLAEARQLYRQVYQSPGMRGILSSLELGHAAAYCAYYTSIRTRPLQGDIELERENLVGLAIAEASRLNHQFGRDINIDALTVASEAAARTACRIFTQTRGAFVNETISRPSYTGDPYTDLSEPEDFEMVQQLPSRAVRGRSLYCAPRPTFSDTAAVISDMGPGQNGNRVPLNASYFDAPLPGSRYPPTPYPSSTRYLSTPQTLQPYSSTPYANPGTVATTFPGTTMSSAVTYQVPSYSRSGSTIFPSRHRSASFSSSLPVYTALPVQATSSYTNTPYGYPAAQPGQTIVIDKPKKHRHSHHHHHRHHSSR